MKNGRMAEWQKGGRAGFEKRDRYGFSEVVGDVQKIGESDSLSSRPCTSHSSQCTNRARNNRRGFVIVAVMIIIGSLLFIATGLIFSMQTASAATSNVAEVEQTRALIRSGLAIVQTELDRQRDDILDGNSPTLSSSYTIYESANELGIVRLLPHGPAQDILIAEAGKLDVNTATADQLVATGIVDVPTADAIVKFRDTTLKRPLQSLAELLAVKEVSAKLLYGPLDEINILSQTQLDAAAIGDDLLVLHQGAQVDSLSDVLTVFAVEPELQESGRRRINLNVEWSDKLRDRIAKRFDDNIANGLKALFEQGTTFEDDTKLVELLLQFDVPLEDWQEGLDTFVSSPHLFALGRLDVNTASYEALLGVPGIKPEQAAAIVDARGSLARNDRRSIAWPGIEEIVEPEQYSDLAGNITTRCWTWRVRIAAGTVAVDDPDGPLRNPIVMEAVIDLSAPDARVAYLRDVSQLEAAAMIALNSKIGMAEDLDENVSRSFDDESSAARDSDDADVLDASSADGPLDFGNSSDNQSRELNFGNSEEDQSRELDFGNDLEEALDEFGNRSGRDDRPTDENDLKDAINQPPAPRRIGRWQSGDVGP